MARGHEDGGIGDDVTTGGVVIFGAMLEQSLSAGWEPLAGGRMRCEAIAHPLADSSG